MDEEGEGEAGVRKRKRGGGEEEAVVVGGGGGYEKELLLAGEEEDGEGCYEGIAEEAVEEVMRWLEMEISAAAPGDGDAAGFVTINGNEESCGPSFSAAASTVMASVDTRAGAPPPPPVLWPWPWPPPEAAPSSSPPPLPQEVDAAVEVAEMGEADEDWLVQLLTCGSVLEDPGLAMA